MKPSIDLDTVPGQLRAAARILERHGIERADSAAWRIADALMVLSGHSSEPLPGVHTPTGRGAVMRNTPPTPKATRWPTATTASATATRGVTGASGAAHGQPPGQRSRARSERHTNTQVASQAPLNPKA